MVRMHHLYGVRFMQLKTAAVLLTILLLTLAHPGGNLALAGSIPADGRTSDERSGDWPDEADRRRLFLLTGKARAYSDAIDTEISLDGDTLDILLTSENPAVVTWLQTTYHQDYPHSETLFPAGTILPVTYTHRVKENGVEIRLISPDRKFLDTLYERIH